MAAERCETCRYWEKYTAVGWINGVGDSWWCHRFPMSVQKAHDDWCGEWRERERDPMDVAQR